MSYPSPKKTTLKDLDIGRIVRHYISLLWRWKIYIILSFPVVTAIAIGCIFKFGDPKPKLTASTIIGIDRPTASVNDVFVDTPEGSSLVVMLRSRKIRNAVVKELSLNVILPQPFERSQIFDSLHAGPDAAKGEYVFEPDKNSKITYRVYYSNSQHNINKKLVASGRLTSREPITLPGIELFFSSQFSRMPFRFTFYITSVRNAAEDLLKRMNVSAPDPRRGINHITLSVEGHDYTLISRTANALAEEFVAQNLSNKQRRLNRVIEVLRTKLDNTQNVLNSSKGEFTSFMSRNPDVSLPTNTDMLINDLSRLKTSKNAHEENLERAQQLRQEYMNTGSSQRHESVAAILQFLAYNDNAKASVLLQSFRETTQRAEALRNTYSSSHPIVQENRTRIGSITRQSLDELNSYIRTLNRDISHLTNQIDASSQQLRRLPQKQMYRAQLESEYQARNEMANELRSQYNQALSERETIVPDVLVMEEAVPPLPPSDFINTVKLLAIAVAVGFGCAIGLPILFNMLDKTARTEYELTRLTTLPFLASIPSIPRYKVPSKEKKNE